MIIKAMAIGFAIGMILGLIGGGGLSGAFYFGVVLAILAVPLRKWLFRTFWH